MARHSADQAPRLLLSVSSWKKGKVCGAPRKAAVCVGCLEQQFCGAVPSDRPVAPSRGRRGDGGTLGADKHYDTHDFVGVSRDLGFTPHISQNLKRAAGSALAAGTTRHEGYAISRACRLRIERVFGWLKPIAGLRKVKWRGLPKVAGLFTFVCAAYNLKRLVRLEAAPA